MARSRVRGRNGLPLLTEGVQVCLWAPTGMQNMLRGVGCRAGPFLGACEFAQLRGNKGSEAGEGMLGKVVRLTAGCSGRQRCQMNRQHQ